jgi:hypothetical protein
MLLLADLHLDQADRAPAAQNYRSRDDSRRATTPNGPISEQASTIPSYLLRMTAPLYVHHHT